MSWPSERLPQEEENLATLYDPKTTAPGGHFAYQGEFPSASTSRRGPQQSASTTLSTPRATGASQRVEKAKFRDSPMDNSEVEILEASPAAPPTVSMPRPKRRLLVVWALRFPQKLLSSFLVLIPSTLWGHRTSLYLYNS